MIKREDYYSDEQWEKYLQFSQNIDTPCLIIDLNIIKEQYQQMTRIFPYAKVYYAMKANPSNQIIEILRDLGCNFDVASIYELNQILSLGISPEKVSYGNTIKSITDIKYFYQKGVRLFVTDSIGDLNNIAKYAPGSQVFVRLLVLSETADWPLSKKFGCHPDKAIHLLKKAKGQNLIPYGISFHVGSQQRDIGEWCKCIAMVKCLFDQASYQGIELKMINLGGGLPAKYIQKAKSLQVYASEIYRYLKIYFHENIPEIILEPGRSLVGNAGILITKVIKVEKKNQTDSHKWVYLDAGIYNGLIETINESIQYPIVTASPHSGKEVPYIVAGPTCDSIDVMYEKNKYMLPKFLPEGERLYWLTAGAYTNSSASVGFNGFPPIQSFFIS